MSYKGYTDLKGKSSTEDFEFDAGYLDSITSGSGTADDLGEGKTLEVVENAIIGKQTAENAIDWAKEEGGEKLSNTNTKTGNQSILPWIIAGTVLGMLVIAMIIFLNQRKRTSHKKGGDN
jgi:hypothetical protein